jgi:selenocysteine lyase/cysteine desulfurase
VLKENEGNIKLVTITAMSNISGYKTPFYQVAELAHKYGAKISLDACQYVQHAKLDIKDPSDPQHIDFCSFSGHKMYAPYGGGALVGPKYFFD